MNKDTIITNLEELPEEIYKQEIIIVKKEMEIMGMKESLDKQELSATSIVINEIDDKGKPKFTNETSRGVALNLILQTNKEYIKIKEVLGITRNALNLEKIILNRLLNQFKAYRSIALLRSD